LRYQAESSPKPLAILFISSNPAKGAVLERLHEQKTCLTSLWQVIYVSQLTRQVFRKNAESTIESVVQWWPVAPAVD
jgi:hypothetical protein